MATLATAIVFVVVFGGLVGYGLAVVYYGRTTWAANQRLREFVEK